MLVIDRSQLDALRAETKDSLDDTKAAKTEAASFLENEGEEIKGAEQAGKRIAKMYVPGAREVLSIQKSIGKLSAGNLMGAAGLMSLALVLYQKLQVYYEEQRQRFQKLEEDIRQQQGYNREQFNLWYSQQQTAMASSYQRPINR
jgi:hypothetical protein